MLSKFRVDDLLTGHINPSGNLEPNNKINYIAQKLIKKKKLKLDENSDFKFLHNYINVTTNITDGTDSFFGLIYLRFTVIKNMSAYKNSLFYGISPSNDTPPEKINWIILLANTIAHKKGDYFDIELTNIDNYKELYIAFLLVPDGWNKKIVYDVNKKICMIPDDIYYINNTKYSKFDISNNHIIISKPCHCDGLKNFDIVIAFEDMDFSKSDQDYCDVVISMSCPILIENF